MLSKKGIFVGFCDFMFFLGFQIIVFLVFSISVLFLGFLILWIPF